MESAAQLRENGGDTRRIISECITNECTDRELELFRQLNETENTLERSLTQRALHVLLLQSKVRSINANISAMEKRRDGIKSKDADAKYSSRVLKSNIQMLKYEREVTLSLLLEEQPAVENELDNGWKKPTQRREREEEEEMPDTRDLVQADGERTAPIEVADDDKAF